MKKSLKNNKSLSLNKVTVNKLDKKAVNAIKGGQRPETRNTGCLDQCETGYICEI